MSASYSFVFMMHLPNPWRQSAQAILMMQADLGTCLLQARGLKLLFPRAGVSLKQSDDFL